MTAMLNDNDDVIRSSFRRGQMYNDVTAGIQCCHQMDSDSDSGLSHWVHGPLISSYLRQVR